MKHNLKITTLLLAMFIITQLIGLYVVSHYSDIKIINGEVKKVSAPPLPYGLDSPEIEKESDYYGFFSGIIFAFIIAIFLLFLFTKLEFKFILKLWFFVVVVIALGISLSSFLPHLINYKFSLIALAIALPLAYFKVYKKDFFIHNLTELFIYPGIAAVFVPLLNLITISILLVLISVYDIWAVWHSGIMQKMAKYQINKLNVFSGFFIPYFDKKTRKKIRELKAKKKKGKLSKKEQARKFNVHLAILGGGDIIFPIITAGVVMKTLGIYHSFFVLAGSAIGLAYLFFFAKKKKFYPAMPFITAGIFVGIGLSWLIF